MFKIQYRSSRDNWRTWNTGEFESIELAMKHIIKEVYMNSFNVNDFQVVSITSRSNDYYVVYEISKSKDLHFRFMGESPWKIGLNEP